MKKHFSEAQTISILWEAKQIDNARKTCRKHSITE